MEAIKNVKIAIFTETSSWGGISTYCLQLAHELLKRKIDVTIVCPIDKRASNKSVVDYCMENNIPLKTIPFNKVYDRQAIKLVNDFLLKENIDIVHTNAYRFNIFIKLCRLILRAKGKYVNHVVSVHGTYIRKHKGDRLWLYHLIDNLTAFSHSITICVSRYTQKIFLQRTRFINASKVRVVYSGISSQEGDFIKLKSDTPGIMFAGRLEEEKGIIFLCSIIERFLQIHPDFSGVFNIYGDGTLKELVLELEKHHPGKVIYHGFTNDLAEAYKKNHILLITSIIETFGLVILEAASYDVITIASKVGGIPEIIKDGVNGILVNYGEIDEFVNKLYTMIFDKAWSTKHLELKTLCHDFSLDKMVNKTIKIYNNLPDRKNF